MLQLFRTEDFEKTRERIHVECYTMLLPLPQSKVPDGIDFDNLQEPLTQHGSLLNLHSKKCDSCQFLGL